jgi:hypothetical protein
MLKTFLSQPFNVNISNKIAIKFQHGTNNKNVFLGCSPLETEDAHNALFPSINNTNMAVAYLWGRSNTDTTQCINDDIKSGYLRNNEKFV